MRRGSDAIALLKERSRLALRLAGLQLVRSIYAGWRHKCLIRPTFLPAGSPQDRQAQRRRAVRLHTCGSAGWRHKCLIRPTFLPAGSPRRPGKRSAAGRPGAVPAVVPDGGINALSGLQKTSFPPGPRKRSAAGQLALVPLSSPSGAGPDPAGRGQNSSAPGGSDPDTRPDSA